MSEQGNAKNLANFSQYIAIVTALGTAYKPGNPKAEIAFLQTKLTDAQAAFDAVVPKATVETNKVNERQAAFEPLRTLVTRINSAAAANIEDEAFLKDLQTISRKLQGRRASEAIEDDPLTPEDESQQSHSASQMSYDNRAANFAAYIDLLKSNAAFAPNETELQTGTLETMLTGMQTTNTAAVTAVAQARAARANRDEVLYNDTDGLQVLADLVKKYVKSVFGTDSPQYQQLQALKIKKP
jgi:hypothetical protein